MAPAYAWPFMMIGYSVLIKFLIKSPNWKITFKDCFLFFFGFFIVSLYWISNSLRPRMNGHIPWKPCE
jgi:apolipoprotein N-acyltransferase